MGPNDAAPWATERGRKTGDDEKICLVGPIVGIQVELEVHWCGRHEIDYRISMEYSVLQMQIEVHHCSQSMNDVLLPCCLALLEILFFS